MFKFLNASYNKSFVSNFICTSLLAYLATSCSCQESVSRTGNRTNHPEQSGETPSSSSRNEGALTALPPAPEPRDDDDRETQDRGREELAQASPSSTLTPKTVKEAIAYIKPVEGNPLRGKVVFTQVDNGVRVVADVEGLTPGEHGFHVHEHGDCGGKGAEGAGSHYNPTNKKHGGPDSAERHVGDLGNLDADETGYAHYERVDSIIELSGPHSIVGRSVIVHADRDDYTTQPTGNAGAKIGCGVIEAVLH